MSSVEGHFEIKFFFESTQNLPIVARSFCRGAHGESLRILSSNRQMMYQIWVWNPSSTASRYPRDCQIVGAGTLLWLHRGSTLVYCTTTAPQHGHTRSLISQQQNEREKNVANDGNVRGREGVVPWPPLGGLGWWMVVVDVRSLQCGVRNPPPPPPPKLPNLWRGPLVAVTVLFQLSQADW